MSIVKFQYLLGLAFIEGISIMAYELLSAKIMAPVFGESLIVWSSVLGITLFFLAFGYIMGGILSVKTKLEQILYYELIVASLFTILISLFASPIMYWVYHICTLIGDLKFHVSVILSAIIILGLPMFIYGTISPILIKSATHTVNDAGRISGLIYGLSTSGGVIITYLLGFVLIPAYGITSPLITISVLLMFTAVVLCFKTKIIENVVFPILLIICIWMFSTGLIYEDNHQEIIFQHDGILGQLKVADSEYNHIGYRQLLINNIPQTVILNNEGSESYWKYVHIIAAVASLKPKGAGALIFGFAGGSLAMELDKLDISVDAVDIDRRMFSVAKNYFYYDNYQTKCYVDDARHYINTTINKYDIIIFDLASAEVQPWHVFTKEGFIKLRDILNMNGMIVINLQGDIDQNQMNPFHAIINTMHAAQFQTYHYSYKNKAGLSQTLLFASLQPILFSEASKERINACCMRKEYVKEFLKSITIGERDIDGEPVILKDDIPVFENLNLKTIMQWRSFMIDAKLER